MKKKLRVSFSLLSLWEQGEIDRMVAMYLKKDYPKTEAMLDGIKWDELQEASVEKDKKTTKEFGSWKFKNPKGKTKIEHDYNDLFLVKGVLDNYDEPDIFEYKTGKRSASSYLSSMQLSFYAMLCSMSKMPVRKVVVMRYNQHENEFDWAFKWYSNKMVDEARNYIDSIAPDVYEFMEKHNYL